MFARLFRFQANFLILSWAICLSTALSLEQKFQWMEEKLTQLEIEQKTEVNQLKKQVEHQEWLIIALQNERITSKNQQSLTKNVVPRTCQQIRTTDPSLTSGNYWIDPDGQGIGDDPIFVYCNMATGIREEYNLTLTFFNKCQS